MWASHSPDFDSRRPHEFENIQIREGSCSLRIIRVAFLTLREHFSAFGRNIGRDEKIFGMSKNSRWTSRCFGFVCPPGPSCGLRVAFVWPSGYFVWPSVPIFIFLFPKATRSSRRSSRRPHEFGRPSCLPRVFISPSTEGVPKASEGEHDVGLIA